MHRFFGYVLFSGGSDGDFSTHAAHPATRQDQRVVDVAIDARWFTRTTRGYLARHVGNAEPRTV